MLSVQESNEMLSLNNDPEMTINFVEKGLKNIKLSKNKSFILVLGKTGSGKSAFVKWIAGDCSKLSSVEVAVDEFIIKDEGSIGQSDLHSNTLFPELFEKNGMCVFDCPGFLDTRSAGHEIAITYFLKYLCDCAESLKIILVVEYSSLRIGHNRSNFTTLMSTSIDFIKNLEKFKNSITLVVTKVEKPSSDDDVILNVQNFLKKIKQEIANEDNSDMKETSLKLIEILTSENDKIALFRSPMQAGKLSEIPSFVDAKERVVSIINESSNFTSKCVDDFGYTISDKCVNLISLMIKKIDKKLQQHFLSIALKIESDIVKYIEEEKEKISAFIARSCSQLNVQMTDEKLETTKNILRSIVEIDSIEELLKIFKESFPNNNCILGEVEFIARHSKHLDFLETVSKSQLPLLSSATWSNTFERTYENILKHEESMSVRKVETSDEIKKLIENEVKIKFDDILKDVSDKYEKIRSEIELFPKNVAVDVAELMRKELDEIDTFLMRSQDIIETNSFKNFIESLKKPNEMQPSKKSIEYILMLEENLRFLSNILQKEYSDIEFHKMYLQSARLILIEKKNELGEAAKSKSKEISQKINSDIAKKGKFLEMFFLDNTKDFELVNVLETLRHGSETLKQLSGEIGDKYELQKRIKNIADILRINDPAQVLSTTNLFTMQSCQEFLSILVPDISFNINSCTHPFNKTQDFLKERYEWFTLLEVLFKKFSTYPFQRNRDFYNVDDLADWGKGGSAGIKIIQENYEDFVKILRGLNIEAPKKTTLIDSKRLFQLNSILDKTLKSDTHINTDQSNSKSIIIKGEFIKFSDFLDINGKFRTENAENINELIIYALNAVFIDNDLIAIGAKLRVLIIAHKIEVIGERKIVLDGGAGAELSVVENREPGSDGRAGNPGGNAGSFFAVVHKVENEEGLIISMNGGNGSKGEDGVDGNDGKNGRNADANNFEREDGSFVSFSSRKTYYGFKGEHGQNGGNGGKGGLGGSPGTFKIIFLEEIKNITVLKELGSPGENGLGGKGGQGGIAGGNYKKEVHKIAIIGSGLALIPLGVTPFLSRSRALMTSAHAFSNVSSSASGFYSEGEVQSSMERSPSGKNGNSGTSGTQENPEPSIEINPALTLEDFKIFLSEHLKDFNRSVMENFYTNVNDNTDVQEVSNNSSL